MQFPSSLEFARAAAPFLRALPRYLRDVPGEPSLKHYGSGESGHWAVQANQQVAGALACLADDPRTLAAAGCARSAGELRELALAMTRYSLRTHCTGDLRCTDGRQWGRHWISVLGLERMMPGLDLLRPHFTADDEARLRALVDCECGYRMDEYELVAALEASTGRNKPESNIWNGAFLLRAAADGLASANRADMSPFAERGTDYLVNGLSFPQDAEDGTPVRGKPVRERFVGANFFPDGALDHHGYLNVGYAYVCLSNLALLHFSFKRRGLPPPDGFLRHLRDVWEWCKRCTFPDGRLLRIGGDSRVRYTYCQCFALQGWHLAWDLWRDEDAAAFARGYLGLVAKEQAENPDGTFYGRRLASLRGETPWWETRLECDPFTVLATSAHWASAEEEAPSRDATPRDAASNASLWLGAYHGAALLRTPEAVRSAVARAFAGPTRPNARNFHETGPAALCVPANRSDLAEWSGNLFAFVGLRGPKHQGAASVEGTPGGFRWRWEGDILEDNPLGEGESTYPVLHRVCTAEALPDGRTMRFSDRIECITETTLPAGFRALHLQIPNDVYNGFRRTYSGEGTAEMAIDGALAVRSLDGAPLRVHRPAVQGALSYNGLTSLRIDEICTAIREGSVHLLPGDLLCDERYEVAVL